MGFGYPSLEVEVITSYTGDKQVRFLAVCGLLSCRYPRIPNQLAHEQLRYLDTDCSHFSSNTSLRHRVARS
jgi:hypothetical protein